MNGMAIVGVLVNFLVALVLCADDAHGKLGYFLMPCVLLSVTGIILAAAGRRRLGAILLIIGAVVFVPIGLLAAFGGRKILDEEKRQAFAGGMR